jgi:hypothetical protein
MNDADIDRMLSRQDDILPSSGFVGSVMDAVRSEATAPPPIPFPWRRALPVFALAAAALLATLVFGIAAAVQLGKESLAQVPSKTTLFVVVHWRLNSVAGWTCLSLFLALVSARLSMRLAGARS